MSVRVEKYRNQFTCEYMMGPNTVRLLDEIAGKFSLPETGKLMDLGCGTGLSSLFLARETNCEIYAVDLWCSAEDNYRRFCGWGVQDRVIPVHANALDLPFAEGDFDAVVSIDAYHYFGCNPEYFGKKLLPLVKPGGTVLIVVPGLHKEFGEVVPKVFLEWTGEEYALFHSCEWWKNTIGEHPDVARLEVIEMECAEEAWKEWFDSGHQYAVRDLEFFHKGIGDYLNFVGIAVQKKND